MKTQNKLRQSRRTFLGTLWAVATVGLFGQAGAALLRFFKPRIEPGGFGGNIVAGQPEEFQPGTVNHNQNGRFYIVRLEDGGLLAMWHSCTHLGCTVPWREDEGQFHCPCHSSIYNIQGEVVSGPAPRPLDLFSIEIVEDQVVVDTSHPIRRDHFDPDQEIRV